MTVTEDTDTTTIPGTTIKKFTTNLTPGAALQDSTTWTCPDGITNVRYLIVGAGGPGGSVAQTGGHYRGMGGGGAGGVLTGSVDVTPGTSYTIKVGRGGLAVDYLANSGKNGGNSEFSAIATPAYGGGYGGNYKYEANSGGCGGGGRSLLEGGPGGVGSQGYNGGAGLLSTVLARHSGGGGGGAGAIGGDGTTDATFGGHGGNGIQSDITGVNTYYAGGGGGCRFAGTKVAGTGGLGGGADGYIGDGGTANSGSNHLGGGGGAVSDYAVLPGSGGSGVVILQYSPPTIMVKEKTITIIGD